MTTRAGATLVAMSAFALWWPLDVAHAAAFDGVEVASAVIAWVSSYLSQILVASYERAPTLVMVLGALLIVPLLALVAIAAQAVGLRWAPRSWLQTRRHAGPHSTRPTVEDAGHDSTGIGRTVAWLDIDNVARTVLPTDRLVRIGRHEDNEILIPHVSVHRHHALIHQTPEARYVIVDVSGRAGNGVLINGERLSEAQLHDGDKIELGEITMHFASRENWTADRFMT